MEEKRCTSCDTYKPISNFYKHTGSVDGRKHNCRVCYAVAQKSYRETERGKEVMRSKAGMWRARNLEKARELSRIGNARARAKDPRRFKSYELKARYKMSLLEYETLLHEQRGKCAICGTLEPKGMGMFHVDHDHTTLKVRGLLCNNCNAGLGQFADNPERLSAAISYLAESC